MPNLIDYSTTLVEPPDVIEIPMDDKVREMKEFLESESVGALVVVGTRGSGKTNLLAQFVRQYPESTISYFVNGEWFSKRPEVFLRDVCEQMHILVYGTERPFLPQIDALEATFTQLLSRVHFWARTNKRQVCFVIDGIDVDIDGPSGSRVIDYVERLVPTKANRWIGFIGSASTLPTVLSFQHQVIRPRTFSLSDVRAYYAAASPNSTVSDNSIQKLQLLSGGVPAHVVALVSWIQRQPMPIEAVLASLEHGNSKDILTELWNRSMASLSRERREWISIAAHALHILKTSEYCSILNQPPEVIQGFLEDVYWLHENARGEIAFRSGAVRQIARAFCEQTRASALSRIVSYLESSGEHPDLLLDYFSEKKDLLSLQTAIAPDKIPGLLGVGRGVGRVLRGLIEVARLHREAVNESEQLRFQVAANLIRALSTAPYEQAEVDALVAIGSFDEALDLANGCQVAEARAKLVATVLLAMQNSGQNIAESRLHELAATVSTIAADIDAKSARELAARLYPLLPDAAAELLEAVRASEREPDSMDLVAAMAAAVSDDPSAAQFLDSVKQEELRDLAYINASWTSKLGPDDIIERANRANSQTAKAYLLREWVIHNRRHVDVHKVLVAALDAMAGGAGDVVVTLRGVRKLSSALPYVAIEYRDMLVRRIEAQILSVMRKPFEDRIRTLLNLAEAESGLSVERAHSRMRDILQEIQRESIDVDVRAYCLASFLRTLTTVDSHNALGMRRSVESSIDDAFLNLINMSADQLRLMRRVLGVLARVDLEHSLALALMLNSRHRRDLGIQVAVTHYVRRKGSIDKADVLRSLCQQESLAIREDTVSDIVSHAWFDADRKTDATLAEFLHDLIQEHLRDPYLRAEAIAWLLDADVPADKRIVWQAELTTAWEAIENAWIRVDLGYHIAELTSSTDKEFAKDIYNRSKTLMATVPLANETFGRMFRNLSLIAVRAAEGLDLSSDLARKSWDRLTQIINRAPSKLLGVRILGFLAGERLSQNDRTTFDSLMATQVWPGLEGAVPSRVRDRAIVSLAPYLVEHNRVRARELLSQLAYEGHGDAWRLSALWYISRRSPRDLAELEPGQCFVLDYSSALQALESLRQLTHDGHIASVVETLVASIASPGSKLTLQQRNDLLAKVEIEIRDKLPEKTGIAHAGYSILCQAQVELAFVLAAGDSEFRKGTVRDSRKSKMDLLLSQARQIPNVADRGFVLAQLIPILWQYYGKQSRGITRKLVEESIAVMRNIPNAVDRVGRLEGLAHEMHRLGDAEWAALAIRLAGEFASDIQGLDREEVISSLLQLAHQIDPVVADELAAKVNTGSDRNRADMALRIARLKKEPGRIKEEDFADPRTRQVVVSAANALVGASVKGRIIAQPESTTTSWIAASNELEDGADLHAIEAALVMIRQRSASKSQHGAVAILNALCDNLELCEGLSIALASAPATPSLAVPVSESGPNRLQRFAVGERLAALDWISNWIRNNVKDYLRIVDPYFDEAQLWIVKAVPADVEVSIVTSIGSDGLKSRSQLVAQYRNAWSAMCDNDPPQTWVFMFPRDPSDKSTGFHDRYIVTAGAGLGLGSSLNHLGNKEFFVTPLGSDDARSVENQYITPKIGSLASSKSRIAFSLL